MTRKRSPQGDPIEHEIELTLNPGAFIPYGATFSFVSELDEVAAKIAKLISSDPVRAIALYETFLAACYLKIEELDDSSGSFGQFVDELYCGWIKARQANKADPNETAKQLLTWIDQDDYGFCYRLEMDAVKVFNKANLAAFVSLVRERFDAAAKKSKKEDDKLRERPDYLRRRWGEVLRTLYAAQKDVAAYVALAEQSKGGHLIAAYRKWSGLDPWPEQADPPSRKKRRHKVAATDLDLSGPIELVVLSVKEKAARCRLVGSDRVITLRASRLWDIVPGEIAVVKPRKQWTYAGHPYLSGDIESSRLDVDALGLVPLKLEDQGLWTPEEHYWGEDDEPMEKWAKPIIARGPRPSFEMEQVVPGRDPDDFDSDPICKSNDLKDSGDPVGAKQILMELCQADLRCLDAHAHLGNSVFDRWAKEAIRHYEVGVRIGELTLEQDFEGLLPWGHIDNRPFMRCMHGFGLCLWRLERFEEAERVFERMLWLNPTDNQGVRFLIDDVRAKTAWEDREAE